jgi:hypothetical protein
MQLRGVDLLPRLSSRDVLWSGSRFCHSPLLTRKSSATACLGTPAGDERSRYVHKYAILNAS